ncbi:hypothetical protein DP107_14975 [Haloglomus irregulare]|uniref:Uncharacterized protein n=1 Tax=Haloglomus irregulare TaxID=2234134 RepID=A0A554MY14_9EURY|nr:hypothetical protein DP107_14975 [Haloglomus irregulare]
MESPKPRGRAGVGDDVARYAGPSASNDTYARFRRGLLGPTRPGNAVASGVLTFIGAFVTGLRGPLGGSVLDIAVVPVCELGAEPTSGWLRDQSITSRTLKPPVAREPLGQVAPARRTTTAHL